MTQIIIIFLTWFIVGFYSGYLSITIDSDLRIKDLPILFLFSFSGVIGLIAYFIHTNEDKILLKKRK